MSCKVCIQEYKYKHQLHRTVNWWGLDSNTGTRLGRTEVTKCLPTVLGGGGGLGLFRQHVRGFYCLRASIAHQGEAGESDHDNTQCTSGVKGKALVAEMIVHK